jgi:hypothetical protein
MAAGLVPKKGLKMSQYGLGLLFGQEVAAIEGRARHHSGLGLPGGGHIPEAGHRAPGPPQRQQRGRYAAAGRIVGPVVGQVVLFCTAR